MVKLAIGKGGGFRFISPRGPFSPGTRSVRDIVKKIERGRISGGAASFSRGRTVSSSQAFFSGGSTAPFQGNIRDVRTGQVFSVNSARGQALLSAHRAKVATATRAGTGFRGGSLVAGLTSPTKPLPSDIILAISPKKPKITFKAPTATQRASLETKGAKLQDKARRENLISGGGGASFTTRREIKKFEAEIDLFNRNVKIAESIQKRAKAKAGPQVSFIDKPPKPPQKFATIGGKKFPVSPTVGVTDFGEPQFGPLSGFDVKATELFEIPEERTKLERQAQINIGLGTLAAGAFVVGSAVVAPIAATSALFIPKVVGSFIGATVGGTAALALSEPFISQFKPELVTKFTKTKTPPSFDIPKTFDPIKEELAGLSVLSKSFKRFETESEVEARKRGTRLGVGIAGSLIGATIGSAVVSGLERASASLQQALINKVKVTITTNTKAGSLLKFKKTGALKGNIVVPKGSQIVKNGKIITITKKGTTISPKDTGRFIRIGKEPPADPSSLSAPSGVQLDIIPKGKTFVIATTPTPSTFKGILGVPTKPVTAAQALAFAKKLPTVSSKPGVFDITGKQIDIGFGISKKPTTAAEALSFAKITRKVSPKPGTFDVLGSPIKTGTTFKRPSTAEEALGFAKLTKKISLKPGTFDILGRPIKLTKGLAKPVSAEEALGFAKIVRKKSPKLGIFDALTGKKIKSETLGIPLKPVSATEALAFAKKLPTVSPKPGVFDISGRKIKGFSVIPKQKKATALIFKDVFKIEKSLTKGIKIKPSVSFLKIIKEKRTATIQIQKQKPLSIPGSLTALSIGLPRVSKTPTQKLFEKETAELLGISTQKIKPREITGFEKITEEARLSAERGLAQFAGVREQAFGVTFPSARKQALGIRKEFAVLALQFQQPSPRIESIFGTTTIQKPLKKVKSGKKVSQTEAFKFAKIPGLTQLRKQALLNQTDFLRLQKTSLKQENILGLAKISQQSFKLSQRQLIRQSTKVLELEKIKVPDFPSLGIPFQFPKKIKLKKKKKVRKQQAFASFVKMKGEMVRVSKKPLFKTTARALSMFVVDKSASRTGTIKAIPGIPRGIKIRSLVERKFRKPIKSGMPQLKSSLFIEKTKFAIDSPGERKQITQKGLEALRMGFFKKRKKRKIKRRKKK